MLGDSILHWAGAYAQERGREVGGSLAVSWCGVRGMKWADFQHNLQLGVMFSSAPKYIFLHLGGNDMATPQVVTFRLIRWGLRYVKAAFPNVRVIWIDILPRLIWPPSSSEDQKRRRLNRYGREMSRKINGCDLGGVMVEIDNVTPGFFINDGVHLSQVGTEMLLWALQEKIQLLNN
jgi:lysophospholipase L1-like esterase